MLEDALSQAKNGELVAIAIVKIPRKLRNRFANDYHVEPGTSYDLAAGVMALHHRVGADLNEEFNED